MGLLDLTFYIILALIKFFFSNYWIGGKVLLLTPIHPERYCQQFDKLKEALQIKRPVLVSQKGIVFHQDNVRPYVTLKPIQELNEFEREILTHPPYCLDILAPPDYHLFQCLQNHLQGKRLNTFEEVKIFRYHKVLHPTNFYERGINKLIERWKIVINKQGHYIVNYINEQYLKTLCFFYFSILTRKPTRWGENYTTGFYNTVT